MLSIPTLLNRPLAMFVACTLLVSVASAQESGDFDTWLAALRAEALERGISEASVARAFADITPPVERIIANDRAQPERVQTYDEYLGARVSEWKITNGKQRLAKHAELLAGIARDFGVQPRFLIALWGMETNFGTYPITESMFNVLATLAYDRRRGAQFRAQFFYALEILDSGFPGYEQLTSSWAGAMGQPQFNPENYLKLAVDYDGDGVKDIWNSEADALASIANYFKSYGWRDDQTWGRRVILPPGGEERLAGDQADGLTPDRYCRSYRSMGIWRDLQAWQALGVRREDGGDLPTRSIPAALIIADPGDDAGYLVYRNFCSIMRYNPAFKYALSIGLLADLLEQE